MAYSLNSINERAARDPASFIAACDVDYNRKLGKAADQIIANLEKSPIVLLSGPSGSGKTTTALKIEEELNRRGIRTHAISMDNYFKTYVPGMVPLTKDGQPDFESPLCMDMDLLNEHFAMLSRGERIYVPKFEFTRQIRVVKPAKSLKLGKNEVAIFEGIHALNDDITTQNPNAFKLYISAYSNVVDENNQICFTGAWMRLARRTVRDHLFRGADAKETLTMWPNVCRGERRYITPFIDKADFKFDSSFPYEICVMKNLAPPLFQEIPETEAHHEELDGILPAYEKFVSIDPDLLLPSSLLREFIGGGIYKY